MPANAMTACIFIGPSLAQVDALAIYPQCHFLPPVQHGSIYEAIQQWPLTAIGVIDGYFQHRPSVWHKEILWALDQGVYVAGAASMGALRAAELAPFGMVGIGKVFKAFEQGAMPPFSGLNDDDEVAVMHGPAEAGFVAVTEAMVNVRHTLEAACALRVIDADMARKLTDEAKSLHFSNRTYSNIIEQAKNHGISSDSLQIFSNWLTDGKIDQKRADAIELVEHMANIERNGLPESETCFYFETTEIFHDALQSTSGVSQQVGILIEQDSAVLDELRLNEEAYRNAKLMAVAKCILTEQLLPQSLVVRHSAATNNDPLHKQLIDDFRRTNGLLDRVKIDQWLAENDLELTELEDLFLGEAKVSSAITLPDTPPVSTELINHLKLTGEYPPLARRARLKRDVLSMQQQPAHHPLQLLNWYFETKCRSFVPTDLVAYAQGLGMSDQADLLRLLAYEYQFLIQNDS